MLRDCIVRIRELGDKTSGCLAKMRDMLEMTEATMRKLCGMDLVWRLNDLEYRVNDQRARLEKVGRQHLQLGKGADDSDGYTSTSEEATFVYSLQTDLPSLTEKQSAALQQCDRILSAV